MNIDAGCTVTRTTMHGGRREGVEMLEVDNGRLRLALLPQRGMGIWKAWLGDVELGWHSPVHGPVHPAYVSLHDPSGEGWLEGFDELLCRCGLVSNGAPDFDAQGRLLHPLHGRIANLPAEHVDIDRDPETGRIAICGVVYETRFHHQKLRLRSTLSTRPDEAGFDVHDEVTNLSAEAASVQMLYHYNLGTPLLGAGASVVAPIRELVPRDERAAAGIQQWHCYGPPCAGFAEQVYFADLFADAGGGTLALLKNAESNFAASVRFNQRQLPCFVIWKNTVDLCDGYVTGIEPSTNFPNPRSFEADHGRVVSLAPGQSVSFDLRFDFHEDAGRIRAVESEIESLRSGRLPFVHPNPRLDWCARA